MNLRNSLVAFALIASLAVGGFTFSREAQAQTTPTTVAELLQRIEELRDRIAELQNEVATLLTSDLALGMSGDEVKELQELLASDPEIYPEGLITGFFGPMTEKALKRFQERFGIDSVGRLGPMTRAFVNQILKEHGKNLRAFKFDNDDDDDVDLSEFTPGTKGVLVCHKSGGPNHTIAIGGPAVRAHLAHGDSLGRCDDDDEDEDEDEDEDDNQSPEEEAAEAIDDAQAAIDEAEDAIADASGDTADAEALLEDANDKLDEAEEAFDEEDFEDAEELADEAEDLADEAEDLVEDEGEFDVEVEIENGDTTVSFTFENNDYDVTINDSTDEDDVLEAVADELNVDVEDLDEDLEDEIQEELQDEIDDDEEDDDDDEDDDNDY